MANFDGELDAFFQGPWQKLLEGVPEEWSWDRKACWLLWTMGSHYDAETPWHWQDVIERVVKDMSRLQTEAKSLEGQRETVLAGLWAARIKERFGLTASVVKAEFMTEVCIYFPGKGWDSVKMNKLSVIVLSPNRNPNRYEAERMALDNTVAAFDNVDALLSALEGVVNG